MYRVTVVVKYLGWVDLDLGFSAILPNYTIQPVQPNSHLSNQNRADSGMTEIVVNPTQVCDHQSHPVPLALRGGRSVGGHYARALVFIAHSSYMHEGKERVVD